MANIPGIAGCIFPHSDKPHEQTLSLVLPEYKCIPISSPPFWSLHIGSLIPTLIRTLNVSVDSYPDSCLLWNPNRLPYGESLASRDKDYQMVGFGPRAPSSFRSDKDQTSSVALKSHWKQESDISVTQVPLNLKSNQSLVWWTTVDNLRQGICLGAQKVNHLLFTDSSNMGWVPILPI